MNAIKIRRETVKQLLKEKKNRIFKSKFILPPASKTNYYVSAVEKKIEMDTFVSFQVLLLAIRQLTLEISQLT